MQITNWKSYEVGQQHSVIIQVFVEDDLGKVDFVTIGLCGF